MRKTPLHAHLSEGEVQTTHDTADFFDVSSIEVPSHLLETNGHTVFMPSWRPGITVERTIHRYDGETRIEYRTDSRCDGCGERLVLSYDESTGRASVTGYRCAVAGGVVVSNTIEVPSGKVAVADYLGVKFDVEDPHSWVTTAAAIRTLANRGVAYGPLTNNMPSLYRTPAGAYVIATLESVDEDPHKNYGYPHEPIDRDRDETVVPLGWEGPLATICTDLWGYQIMDHDAYLAVDIPHRRDDDAIEVVEVPAGTYTVVHHTMRPGFNLHEVSGLTVYATLIHTAVADTPF